MGKQVLVGIAEMKTGTEPGTLLVAPNLGSCVAVAVYDQAAKVGAMIHCLLPSSQSDPAKAAERPYMYVDTGVVKLFESILALGAAKKNLLIVAAGGAQINDPQNVFEIGKKNVTSLRKVLWKNSLLLKGSDFGEDFSRTLSLNCDTGEVVLKAKGETKILS